MNVAGRKFLLTGATGGIGSELAMELGSRRAGLLLTARDADRLKALEARLIAAGARPVGTFAADLSVAAGRERLARFARTWHGGVDGCIHAAGIGHFGLVGDERTPTVESLAATNLVAPVDLTRLLLPHFQTRPDACIVNIGSVFGSIGHPGFAVYCATKFGLRGFSEALRRELAGSPVHVHYYEPRATQTGFNPATVGELNASLGNTMDDPSVVARQLVNLLETGRPTATLGWPEKFFVRLNALLPGLVDRALGRRTPVIARHARGPDPVHDASPAASVIPPGRLPS